MYPVILSLGSNKVLNKNGSVMLPQTILENAVGCLKNYIENLCVSSVYCTKPMYFEDQESFYNLVVGGTYHGEAEELLEIIQAIEADFGRNRSVEFRNGPRTLDIDIILFYNKVCNSQSLSIPHPRYKERAFVLVPMLEILHNHADYELRDYYKNCLNKLNSEDVVKFSTLKLGDFSGIRNHHKHREDNV